MSFNNKVVIVTGGSMGIGAAIAVAFAKESANVVIIGRNEANLKKVAQSCDQYGSKSFIIKADITKDEEVRMIVKQTVEKFGKIDVLVNNAGILKAGELLKGNALETYDDIFKSNLRAAVHLTSVATPYLVKTKGNIVNVSSVLATGLVQKRYDFTAYGMSKVALNYFTRASALELSAHGVRVNSVSPGPTKTGIFDAAGMENDWEDWGKVTALGKYADCSEVADLVAYLASDKAKSVTGSDYGIDNGLSLI